jgi:ribosome-binding factor A
VKGLKDPRIGFVTVTGVKVTDDLHHATVYFTVIGSDDEKKATAAGLASSSSFIRKGMGKLLRMRYVPEIHFVYDTSLDYGNRIDAILREIGPDGEADA